MNFIQTTLKENKIIAIVAIVYLISSVSFIFTSGWERCDIKGNNCTVEVAEYHAHDAFWHMAIAENSFEAFPPSNPVYSGVILKGYNYLFDFILFITDKIFRISPLHGYFHFFPIVTSLFYIVSVYYFVTNFGFDKKQKIFVSLFLFLGNSYAFLMTLFSQGTLTGSLVRGFPLVLSLQPTTMFYNHQYALSLPIILFSLVYIRNHKDAMKKYIFLGVIIVLLTLLKAYAGISVLLLLIIYLILKTRKNNLVSSMFYAALLSTLFLVATIFIGGGGGKTFSFDQFAFVRSLIDDPSHFYRENIALARVTLETSGKFSPRLVLLYFVFTSLWYLVNFGARTFFILNIAAFFRSKEKTLNLALVTTIIILSLVPLFVLQKGDWFNTMQFMYYAVLFSSISAGVATASVIGLKKYMVYSLIIITLLIPLADQIRHSFLAKKVVLSADFINTTNHLRSLPKGDVTTFGMPAQDSRIAAFSGQTQSIADIPVLVNIFVDYEKRKEETETFGYVKSAKYIFVDKQKYQIEDKRLKNKKLLYQNEGYAILENI